MTVLDGLHDLRRKIARRYRESELHWHLRNARSELAYRLAKPALPAPAAAVVSDLNRDGIAIVPAHAIVDRILVEAVLEASASLRSENAREIEAVREGRGTGNKGHYRLNYLGVKPTFDPDSALARFAMSPEITQIADAYYGLAALLRYYNIWHTFPTSDPPGDSQLWHRDQEDRFIFKVFLYLEDVSADSGPLSYVPGSHRKGPLQLAPEAFREPGHGNLRSRDDQMERVAPRERWRHATGPSGSLVFVDTGGYHKGGFSRTLERLVYTCMFTSPASVVGHLFARDPQVTR